MIKVFCDTCAKEIPSLNTTPNSTVFGARRVSIGESNYAGDFKTDYLIELVVTANIYKPKDLMDELKSEDLIGHNICADCIIETLKKEKV